MYRHASEFVSRKKVHKVLTLPKRGKGMGIFHVVMLIFLGCELGEGRRVPHTLGTQYGHTELHRCGGGFFGLSLSTQAHSTPKNKRFIVTALYSIKARLPYMISNTK